VTGKGGTGKSTIAAALALTLAAGGRKVLLVEVEGRQGIAQLFDVPPLPYKELKIATAERGGQVNALAIELEAAFLEYLDMFYNLGIAGRAMRRIGAIEFATTIAPGLRDVLLTGKIKETVIRVDKNRLPLYDAIVVDAPPTGRIAASWTSPKRCRVSPRADRCIPRPRGWSGCCTPTRPPSTWSPCWKRFRCRKP
jgi:anion-transporting  ArsA/GET3 family ATPase